MNHRTLVLGLEHFIDKIGYQAAEYARRGIDVRYLVLDKSGLSRMKAREYGAAVALVPVTTAARLRYTMRRLRELRPDYVELYDIGRLTVPYALLARLSGARLVVILRGTELKTRRRRALRQGIRAALRLADHVVAKELHIVRDLEALGVPGAKVTFIGNCVPLPDAEPAPMAARDIDVLFLNSVRSVRNPQLLVRALPDVLRQFPMSRVVIAGFTCLDDHTTYRMEEKTELEVLDLIDELGLKDHVEVAGFVSDPASYYRRAKVFVLPADVVFANYSLLEAMSYGVAPLVGDGEGAGRIVRSGENGLIVQRTNAALAEGLQALLGDAARLERLGAEARRTISRKFSMNRWGEQMMAARAAIPSRRPAPR